MANFSPDHEGEIPVIRTEAEITLKKLLDKQLSTTGRLEQVDFEEATESMHCIGHGSSGVASLSQFLKNEVLQKRLEEKARSLRSVLHSKGFSKAEVEERCRKISHSDDLALPVYEKGIKRNRYGAHPSFVFHAELEEHDIDVLQRKYTDEERLKAAASIHGFGRHAKELEASLLKGKDRLKAIAHLSAGGSTCRKPLVSRLEQSEIYIGTTPQDRARFGAEQEISRSAGEVFSNRAPEVLDLHTYLDQRPLLITKTCTSASTILQPVETTGAQNGTSPSCLQIQEGHPECNTEIPEAEILRNRLSEEEIRQLPCGKFANYSPGEPSHILYIKNLSPEVTEADLVALFLRYQVSGQQLLFRLMKRGRMKGQAFITFSDEDTSLQALQMINGYKLKGRPMVIEFGRAHPRETASSLSFKD